MRPGDLNVLAADAALRLWDAIHRHSDLWNERIWAERRRLVKAKDEAIREALGRV